MPDQFPEAYEQIRQDFNLAITELHDTVQAITAATVDVEHSEPKSFEPDSAELERRAEGPQCEGVDGREEATQRRPLGRSSIQLIWVDESTLPTI